MRRARHPLPVEMRGIRTDPGTGRYVLTEDGATYYLTIEHTRMLKEYYRANGMDNPKIVKWYGDLDRFTRKEITVVGLKKVAESDFYPDTFYE